MIRFGWRLQRFELATVILLAFGASAAMVMVILGLRDVAPPPECIKGFIKAAGELPAGCPDIEPFMRLRSAQAEKLLGAMTVLPFLLGLLPGSSLLASEIEHRTAQFSWMLAQSRRRWLLERLAVILLVVLTAAVVTAVAAELLEQTATPWLDSRASFGDYGVRGPVAVSRTIAFASIGLLVGSILGRQIPALVVSLGLSMVLLIVVTFARPFGVSLEPVEAFNSTGADLSVAARYRADDGSLLSYEEAVARRPAGMTVDQAAGWVGNHFAFIEYGVPGDRLSSVELRESVVLLVVVIAATAATFVVVERRRPY